MKQHSSSKAHENSLSPITDEPDMGGNNNNSNNGMYHPAATHGSQMTHRNSSAHSNARISQHNMNNFKQHSCNTMSNSSASKTSSSSTIQDSGHSSSMSSNSGGSPTGNRASEKSSRLSDQSTRDFPSFKSTNGPSTPRMHSHSINPSAPNPFLPPSSGTSPLLSPNSLGFNPHSPRTSGAHHPFMPPFSPYFQMQLAANFMAPASPLGLPSLNGLSPMMGSLNAASSSQGSTAHASQSTSRHHVSAVEGKS